MRHYIARKKVGFYYTTQRDPFPKYFAVRLMYLVRQENAEFLRLIQFAGWSQTHAAARLGMHRVTVNQICRDKQKPSTRSLKHLASITGGILRLSGLTEASDDMANGRTNYSAEGWEHELLQELRKIPRDAREGFIQMAKTAAKTFQSAPPASPKITKPDRSGAPAKPVPQGTRQEVESADGSPRLSGQKISHEEPIQGVSRATADSGLGALAAADAQIRRDRLSRAKSKTASTTGKSNP
jgi:transcriptional regulator with XRE-family HTH domain